MSLTEATTTAVPKARKPVGNAMAPLSFLINPGARWDVECRIATMPVEWLTEFRRAWQAHPGYRQGNYLPTRRLVDLLIGVEPAVMCVDGNPESDAFIIASEGADPRVLTAAIASWAQTELCVNGEGPDWFDLLDPSELVFETRTVNLFEHDQHANGTAAGSRWMFKALPTFLASHVTATGLRLLGKDRRLLLGPPQSDGRRDAVLWPPVQLSDPRAGDSLATVKITFHVETQPGDPRPHIHADLTTSRFPLMPVSYVPARGDGPASATIWLHAPEGFLRPTEPHTLLAATATQAPVKGGGRRWQWSPGLARTLARFTHLAFPDPEKVFAHPASNWTEGGIRALILYSEGTKSTTADADDPTDAGTTKARSLLHAANTGLVPDDHIEVHRQLAARFADLGITAHPGCDRVGPKTVRTVRTPNNPEAVYDLELRTSSNTTRDAVLAALTAHMNLERRDGADAIAFTGETNIRLHLSEAGSLAGPVPRQNDERQTDAVLLGRHANRVTDQLGPAPQPRATILELEGADYFSRTRQVDPKTALKKGFARSGRRLQCLTPATEFKEPKSWPENSTRKKPAPYPGTNFASGTIHRAAAAVNDALRQLGRVSAYQVPGNLPELEHIAIAVHKTPGASVPILIRMQPGQHPVAHLAGRDEAALAVGYSDLPEALATGKGRIKTGRGHDEVLARFLENALGVGAQGAKETHDRIVYIRAGSFRNRSWKWLQDQYIQPDRLVLPGAVPGDPDAKVYTPADCTGLRIVRIRDRSSQMEVARGFAADPDNYAVRISGLFTRTDRVYSSINPRSDQMQTPLGITKLDEDLASNFTAQVGNPVPLEIYTAFLQRGDRSDDYAQLISGLRRNHLHTEQNTALPGLLHLCNLAAEYL